MSLYKPGVAGRAWPESTISQQTVYGKIDGLQDLLLNLEMKDVLYY